MASKTGRYTKRESSCSNRTAAKNSGHYVRRDTKTGALTETDEKAERRKDLTIRAFNAAYESHHKKR